MATYQEVVANYDFSDYSMMGAAKEKLNMYSEVGITLTGDSNIRYIGLNFRDVVDYPFIFKGVYPAPGALASSLPSRREYREALASRGDIIVIMVGSNDVDSPAILDGTINSTTIADRIFEVARIAVNGGLLPYIVELPGRFNLRTPNFTPNDYKNVSRACNKTLHHRCGSRLIRLPLGFRNEDAYRDGVHFTQSFANQIATKIFERVELDLRNNDNSITWER